MKVLIWFSTILVATVLNGLLGYITGIKAGYIVFYIAVYFVAKRLCKAWDEHKVDKEVKTNPHPDTKDAEKVDTFSISDFSSNKSLSETALETENIEVTDISTANQEPQIVFCRKCGTKLIEGAEFCKKCGIRKIREEET